MSEESIKVVGGRYKVIKELGSGAAGDVWLAETSSGSLVAVKLLNKSLAEKKAESIIERFKAEFSILKDLSHPGINKVYDFGFDKDLGQYYFTSEYIAGLKFLSVAKNAEIEQIETLFVSILRALEYLHSRGIVHSDVKSANVMVKIGTEGSYQVKLIDFGLAVLGTQGDIVGTPSYMAPEVILKNMPDSRADLYSLGVLIYDALTGINPFSAVGVNETFSRQLTLIPDPPSRFNSKVPPYLDEILLKLLRKTPAERFPTAAHVIRAINVGGGKSYPVETRETFLGYLPTGGNLVGRRKELEEVKSQALAIKKGDISFPFVLLLAGERGVGKKRLLTELKYFAQLNEIDVIELSSTDRESLKEFSGRISDLLTDLTRPAIVSCSVMGLISADKTTIPMAHLIEELASRIRSARAISNVRAAPRVMIAFTGTSDEIPFLLHLLDINESEISSCQLKNFNRLEVQEYLTALTDVAELPERFVNEVMNFTEGNPVFITEVVKALIEEGFLFDKVGRWNAENIEDIGVHLDKIKVPKTLSAVLDRQYENADKEERDVLETMAVWHRPVTINELDQVLKVPHLPHVINSLVVAGIVSVDIDGSNYFYANTLLREVVYSKMPEDRKFSLHEIIANYLREVRPEAKTEILWHAGRSPDLKASIDTLIELARYHLERSEGADTVSVLEEALARLKDDTYRLKEVYFHMGDAFSLIKHCDQAIEAYSKALYLLEGDSSANNEEKVAIHERLGLVYIRNEQLDRAREVLSLALKYLKAEESIERLSIYNLMARVYFMEGKLDDAINIYLDTKGKWKKLGDEEKKKVRSNDLAHVYLQKGELSLAEEEFAQDLEFFERVDARGELQRLYYALGQLNRVKGRSDEAVRYFEKSILIAKELSNADLLLRAYNGLGNLYNVAREFDKSIYWYERALDLAARTTEDSTASAIAVNIGLIKLAQKDIDRAQGYFTSAINIYYNAKKKMPFDQSYITRARIELADIYRQKKDFVKAEFELTAASKTASIADGLVDHVFWIKKTKTELMRDQGEWKTAKKLLPELDAMAKTEEERDACRVIKESLEKAFEESTFGEEIIPKEDEEASVLDVHSKSGREKTIAEKYYRQILEINKYLSGEEDINFILKTILKYALELARADAGLVLLVDGDGNLQIESSCNVDLETGVSEVSVRVAREALKKDEIIVTEDAVDDERFKDSKSIILLGLKSVVCIPVHSGKKAIGVIYLVNRSKKAAFSDINKDVLSTFADQTGIAIHNAGYCSKLEATRERLTKELAETSAMLKHLDEELRQQRARIKGYYRFDRLVSANPSMQRVFETMQKVSDTSLTVLITGDVGTGKELTARTIHYNSGRGSGPFVAINCETVPAAVIESELFGCKADAVAGVAKDKMGLFEVANGGTIFLDEIEGLDLALQARLLRVMDDGEVVRVGDTKPIKCDVRVISASHLDLEKLARENKFNQALYQRISEIKVSLLPLRERTEDIPILINEFIDQYCGGYKMKKGPKVGRDFMKACLSYSWPANIHELENTIKIAMAFSDGDKLALSALPDGHPLRNSLKSFGKRIGESVGEGALLDGVNRYNPRITWEEQEAVIIAAAYKLSGFDVKETGRQLQIATTTVYKKIRELDLNNKSGPLLGTTFVYQTGISLEGYRNKVFKAAWEHFGRHPYQAISALGVSQGYFYKVMKKW